MKKYLVLTFLFICTQLGAQINSGQFNSLSDLQFYVRSNNPSYSEAEGSRYLNDDFLPARINSIQKTQLVRFNVPDNIVEVKNNNNEIMGLTFTTGYTIKLLDGSSKVYETHTYTDENNKNQTTFFENIYEHGAFKLFLKENIKFTAAKPVKSSYEPATPAKFEKVNDAFYFIGLSADSSILTAVPKKRKLLLPYFGEHAPAMEKKIKSDKLNIKDTADLKALFMAYFELLQ